METIDVFDIIERMVALIRSEQRKRCTEMGMQPVHFQVLDYLSRCNKFSDTPAVLSKYLGMTKGTVSQTLLLLQKKGFIEKTPDANDKRVVHLHLCDEGKAALEKARPSVLYQDAALILRQTNDHRYQEFFVQVLSALQKANKSQSFGLCKTCKYFTKGADGFACVLTQEKLTENDSEKICYEHNID